MKAWRLIACAFGLCATVACLSAPAGAGASIASISGGDLRFLAAAGETNNLTVSLSGTDFVLDDPGSTITAMAGCTAVTANQVTCVAASVTGELEVELGDMGDQAVIAASVPQLPDRASISGGAGGDTLTNQSEYETRTFGDTENDTLIGGPAPESLEGGDGDDALVGNGDGDDLEPGPGTDTADGGPGNDRFEAESNADGADLFAGGPGSDEASYRNRTGALTITLDDVADDGESGEGDNIGADVENLETGAGADVLGGTTSDNHFDAGGGNDMVTGAAGDDELDGSAGDDTVSGGPGDDEVYGREGVDSLSGDDGDDFMRFEFSDGDADQMNGGAGIDSYRDGSVLGMNISLDGAANDGPRDSQEGSAIDDVGSDIENIFAQDSPDDVLTGSGLANQIDGGVGNDLINGLDGPDALLGGPGDDRIDGGNGIDQLDGDGGNDVLRSRDSSPDDVNCGSASDTLLADFLDDFTVTCDLSSTGAMLSTSSAKLRKGAAAVKVFCPLAEGVDCRVKMTATRGRKILARGTGTVKSGKSGTVRIKLTKPGKRSRSKKLVLKAKTVLTDATGAKVTTIRPKLVLRR
jgi:Ca2+-binding RTX toxin-like protein